MKLDQLAADACDLLIDVPGDTEVYIEINGEQISDFIIDVDANGRYVLRKEI